MKTAYLLAQEIWVSANAPKTFSYESTFGVKFGPITVGKGPRIFELVATFEVLVCPLLIVRNKLEEDGGDAECKEDLIGGGKCRAGLESGSICGQAESTTTVSCLNFPCCKWDIPLSKQ